MSERLAFLQACLDRQQPVVEICARFGISEKTGHKWIARFRSGGVAALEARSHAPLHHRFHVAPAIAAHIVALRRRHPLYGAAKLRDWLVQQEPETRWPAASTIGELLRREGLIRARRRHAPATRNMPGGRGALVPADAPNAVWTADFKGQFRLGCGTYCYPLTVLDLYSHFLLRCTALDTTAVRSAFSTPAPSGLSLTCSGMADEHPSSYDRLHHPDDDPAVVLGLTHQAVYGSPIIPVEQLPAAGFGRRLGRATVVVWLAGRRGGRKAGGRCRRPEPRPEAGDRRRWPEPRPEAGRLGRQRAAGSLQLY